MIVDLPPGAPGLDQALTPGAPGRWRVGYRGEALALLVLLAVVIFWVWGGWAKIPYLFADQSWGMQVATRVLAGDVLYRDVTWNYGPLPVYVFVLLFRLLGPSPLLFSAVGMGIVAAAHLLTYRLGRFLLPPAWALLAALAALSTFQGGVLAYMQPYSTSVSWGVLWGLVTVLGLLGFARDKTRGWGLVAAGLASGCACLAKPEFALACLGTAACYLGLVFVCPSFLGHRPRARWQPLLLYGLPLLLVVGGGYGLLAWRAGWPDVWLGLSGYRAASSAVGQVAWLGSPWSWLHAIAGAGLGLLLLILVAASISPAFFAARRRLVVGAALGCLAVSAAAFGPIVLGWDQEAVLRAAGNLLSGDLSWLGAVLADLDLAALPARWWLPILASGPLLLLAMALSLVASWAVRAARGRRELAVEDQMLLILVAYSGLAAARFFFDVPGSLHKAFLCTLAPLALYLLVRWLPQQLQARGYPPTRLWQGHLLLVGVLLLWGGGNAARVLDVLSPDRYVSLAAPRGGVLVDGALYADFFEAPFQAILARADARAPIFVVGCYPGFYFLGDVPNPTRWDYMNYRMTFPPERFDEILAQLQQSRPPLILLAELYEGWLDQQFDVDGRFRSWLAENYAPRPGGGEHFTMYELGD